MNYIADIQNAINYMEDHLVQDLNFEVVAKQIGMSPYYFHRIFSIIAGISPAEYIRNRRLTRAAEDLVKNGSNILDIALKYGFESNEAFTRAFSKFHGIAPKYAKQQGNNLKNFSRITLEINIRGGDVLKYRVEDKPAFSILAIVRNYKIETKNEIPMFWHELINNKKISMFSTNGIENTIGVCIGENNAEEYKYGIGKIISEGEQNIDGTELIEVPESRWIVFQCKSQEPKEINDLWSRIYREFFATSNYNQSLNLDFELYKNGSTEIWIPVS